MNYEYRSKNKRRSKLNIVKIFTVVCIFIIAGCASSSELSKKGDNHAKAGEYYKSIGQTEAAEEEYELAKEDRDHAQDLFPALVELFNFFTDKEQ